MPFLNSKGQVSAPFELLIAVVLMGFVLVAGYQAISRLQQQQCESKIDYVLEKFKTSLENVATGKGKAEINLGEIDCMPEKTERIRIVESTEPNICNAYCSGSRSTCSLIQYSNIGSGTSLVKSLCLNISSATTFPTAGSICVDRTGDNYYLRDLSVTDSIQKGFYSLVKASSLTSSVPVVCAYLKCSGGSCN